MTAGEAIQAIREQVVLPSDLLAMARARHPGLEIKFDYPEGGQRLALVVVSERGRLVYERRPTERWRDLFVRSELLR